MKFRVAVLSGLVLASTMLAREPGFREFRAAQESLRYLPPNVRFYEMDRLGLLPRSPAPVLSDSIGLRLVGKWGAGPSVKVTGRDSLVFLSRGSQVAVINYADTANPRVLSYIEVNGLVSRSVLVGDRLYVGSTGSDPKYIDVFDVSNPAVPQRLGSLQTRLLDIDVLDTLVYTVAKDSFRVFDFSDPANPRQIGACRDTGYSLSVCNGYAYIADRWGLYVVDVRDPTSPHHEASWGTGIISVKARGRICCATLSDIEDNLSFYVLDIRQPASIAPLGSLDSAGGYDVNLEGQLAFISGYSSGGHVFSILDIGDSTHPTRVGSCPTPDYGFGVWVNPSLDLAYVANYRCGLATMDIANLSMPTFRSAILKAGFAYDIEVQGGYAFVAEDGVGLVVLDVSVPSSIHEVASMDSTRDMMTRTIAVRDSFAFMGWLTHPWLKVVDVTDPLKPQKAASRDLFNPAEDMVWRDSFLYVAEIARLQVVNVARPRQPVLVGTCVTGDLHEAGLWLQGDLAYVAGQYDGIYIVDVSDPQNPSTVKVLSGMSAWGCCVRDSVLFVSDFDDSLHIWSVANLNNIRELGAVSVSGAGHDVKVLGDYAYVAADGLGLVDISDLRSPKLLARYATPDFVRRVACDSPYAYAACYSGGVCIFDTVKTGVSETRPVPLRAGDMPLVSSPVRDYATVRVRNGPGKEVMCNAYTVAGTRVSVAATVSVGDGWTKLRLDLRSVASGVYLLRVRVGETAHSLRVLKL